MTDSNQIPVLDDEGVKIEERIAVATPAKMMWWKFRKHKMAVGSGVFLIFLYLVAIPGHWFLWIVEQSIINVIPIITAVLGCYFVWKKKPLLQSIH